MQKEETTEEILESLQKKHSNKLRALIIMFSAIGIIIFLILLISAYFYFKSPEKTLGLGANIESVLLSADGTISYIKLVGGSLDKNITKIKFIFIDENGNEQVYETSEGIKEIEVAFKRSFWDWLFGRQLKGIYDYEIKSGDIGLNDFNNINEVGVVFEYKTDEGDVIETSVLDTGTTTRTTTTGGGSSGGNDNTPTCTPNKDCSYYYNLNQCGSSLSDGCANSLNCISCINGTCVNGSCVELIECIDDENCSYLNDVCGIGFCNATNNCEINYNLSIDVCRASSGECDLAEFCSGSLSNCPSDVFNASGTLCSLGFCDRSGSCIECIDDSDCESEESCVNGNCLTGECLDDADCIERGPGFVCNITNSRCEWIPPIGIPKPEFGIEETYRMYDNPANRNPNLTYYENAEGGFYTHYVDNTHPNATDTDNLYGTASKPRLRIPFTVVAGSVVEVHNALAYNEYGSYITGEGTVEMPIFVRGVDDPRLEHMLYVGAHADTQYLIVEGLSAKIGRVLSRKDPAEYTTAYISVRDCDFYGDNDSGGFGVRSESANLIHDVVVYNNKFHDNGIWDPELAVGDRDVGATFAGKGSSYVWFLENEIYHIESTGLIITAGNTQDCDQTHHIYVGRNIAYENKQDGFWTKNAQDVIFSENIAYGHAISSSSLGAGFGYQYDPKRIWYIFNTAYNNAYGFRSGSVNFHLREDMYILGNVVYDCDYGIWLSNAQPGKPDTVASNTIYGIENDGIGSSDNSVEINIYNNIIANVGGKHLNLGGDVCTIDYTLFDTPVSIYWNQYTYSDLVSFQNGEGEGANCVADTPVFTDSGNDDYSLQAGSPGIDDGDNSSVYETFYDLYGIDIRKDIEGRTRPQDGDNNGSAEWDIGAYEYGSGEVLSSNPFVQLLNWIKGLLTTKTGNAILSENSITGNAILTGNVINENAVNETGKGNFEIQYIILAFFVVVILIVVGVVVKKRGRKGNLEKRWKRKANFL